MSMADTPNNVHNLDSRLDPRVATEVASPGASYTATVSATNHGQATELTGIPGQPTATVLAHASNVPWLNIGDEVLALLAADGWVVTHRLRSENEISPLEIRMDQNGVATLEAPEGITLKSGQSEIQIMADGRIRLDGEDITQFGNQAVKLFGATVKLN